MKKPLKVGFDLDGVLLYNPARNIRPFIKAAKRRILNKKKTTFFVPQTPFQVFAWELLHRSSFIIAPGFDELVELISAGRIEAIIATARFNYLDKDTKRWFKRLNQGNLFTKCITNDKNEQPHIYKKAVIKKHQLDLFVEDNWDIVNSIYRDKTIKTDVYWITNFFDQRISYPHKFSNFKAAIRAITRQASL